MIVDVRWFYMDLRSSWGYSVFFHMIFPVKTYEILQSQHHLDKTPLDFVMLICHSEQFGQAVKAWNCSGEIWEIQWTLAVFGSFDLKQWARPQGTRSSPTESFGELEARWTSWPRSTDGGIRPHFWGDLLSKFNPHWFWTTSDGGFKQSIWDDIELNGWNHQSDIHFQVDYNFWNVPVRPGVYCKHLASSAQRMKFS